MLQDIKKFPFLQAIIDNHAVIQKEFLEAKDYIQEIKKMYDCVDEMPSLNEEFNNWVRKDGFENTRFGYVLRGNKPVLGTPILSNQKGIIYPNFFPQTYKILNNIPCLEVAILAIMSPHSHILPHQHFESKGLMIFHLCLFDLDGYATFRVNDEVLKYNKEKDHFLFYPYDEHESYNHSNSYRVNLLIEFPESVLKYKIKNLFSKRRS